MTAKGWFFVTVAVWTAFAVLTTAWMDLEHILQGQPLRAAWTLRTFGEMYTLGLLTPALIYIAHIFPPSRRPALLTLLVYLASLIAVCAIGLPLLTLVGNTFLGTKFTLQTALEE